MVLTSEMVDRMSLLEAACVAEELIPYHELEEHANALRAKDTE